MCVDLFIKLKFELKIVKKYFISSFDHQKSIRSEKK